MNALYNSRTKEDKYSVEPFFETSPYLLCIADYDGYFRRINPAVSRLLHPKIQAILISPFGAKDSIHLAPQGFLKKKQYTAKSSQPKGM